MKGYKVCRVHGAGSPNQGRPGGRPPTHGAYARHLKPEDLTTLEELRTLGSGLEQELALARLQLDKALEWASREGAERCDGKQCPFALVDNRLQLVSKVAERCSRIADGLQVRVVDADAVQRILGVIQKHVTDKRTLRAIFTELEEVAKSA
ncbi:MAG: hypothetical protein JXC32_19335 [Anaerolineae bacterium]|nr:hypothetical protein [Anaerolineae bacterium]